MVSERCIAFIKKAEGFRAKPYWDVNGWAVGYGTHITEEEARRFNAVPIAEEEATRRLRAKLEWLQKEIQKRLKVELTSNQWDAILSWAYNVGIGNVWKSSLLKKLNLGDYKGAADEFLKWQYSGGKPILRGRRQRERKMFLGEE